MFYTSIVSKCVVHLVADFFLSDPYHNIKVMSLFTPEVHDNHLKREQDSLQKISILTICDLATCNKSFWIQWWVFTCVQQYAICADHEPKNKINKIYWDIARNNGNLIEKCSSCLNTYWRYSVNKNCCFSFLLQAEQVCLFVYRF